MSEFAESLWVHGSDRLRSEVHLKLVLRGSVRKMRFIQMKLDAKMKSHVIIPTANTIKQF